MKQFEHQDETSRTARHQVHYDCPYKTYKNLKTTVVKRVQVSKMKAIQLAYNKMTRPYKRGN